MWEYIEERARRSGEFIVETGCTVRACSAHFQVSKSTVHKDVTERLREIDASLYESVKQILDKNLKERHLRGGDATKQKYARRQAFLQKKECAIANGRE